MIITQCVSKIKQVIFDPTVFFGDLKHGIVCKWEVVGSKPCWEDNILYSIQFGSMLGTKTVKNFNLFIFAFVVIPKMGRETLRI